MGRHQNAFEKLAGVPLKNAFAVVFTPADDLFFFNKFDDFSSLKVLYNTRKVPEQQATSQTLSYFP